MKMEFELHTLRASPHIMLIPYLLDNGFKYQGLSIITDLKEVHTLRLLEDSINKILEKIDEN